jgi:hypothetical protein
MESPSVLKKLCPLGPFTDLSDQGVAGLFKPQEVRELVQVLVGNGLRRRRHGPLRDMGAEPHKATISGERLNGSRREVRILI